MKDTTKGFAVRRSSGLNADPKGLDFFGKVIAEHRKGEVSEGGWAKAMIFATNCAHSGEIDDSFAACASQIFGEISCMFRKKCEASVRARTSLDVISLPRKEMMEVLSKNDQMKSDFLNLVQTRR